ncbi:hypothetical protein D1007_03191 [Hordeum vulgare]|nr:hypothetical protein D1007_03191 [Hordeum vulgare]
MDAPDPALVTVEVEVAKSMASRAAVDLPADHLWAAPGGSSNVVPRKCLIKIIVQGGAPVAGTKGAGRPKGRPPARYRDAGNIGETEATEAVKKKVMLKRKPTPPANKAPANSTPATVVVPPVFDGMPERSEYAAILEEYTVYIEDAPLGDYGYNDMDDGEKIAAARYRDMPASKGKPFAFEHYWAMLKNREKWKVRDKEAPPKKGAFTLLDDEDDDEEERNKGRPDGTKKANDNMRKDLEASSLREKIDHMVKLNELMVTMTIEAKKELAMKRSQEKEEKWHQIKESKLRRRPFRTKEPKMRKSKLFPSSLPRRTRSYDHKPQ